MNKVAIGVFLCLVALILLNRNNTLIGIPAFIFGIILMYGGKWPKR
jgi:hypothetical protein